jgi:hypothetical protein
VAADGDMPVHSTISSEHFEKEWKHFFRATYNRCIMPGNEDNGSKAKALHGKVISRVVWFLMLQWAPNQKRDGNSFITMSVMMRPIFRATTCAGI